MVVPSGQIQPQKYLPNAIERIRIINPITIVPINFLVARNVAIAIRGLDLKNKSEGIIFLYGNAARKKRMKNNNKNKSCEILLALSMATFDFF